MKDIQDVKIDIIVGNEFRFDGIEYIAVDKKDGTCEGCAFDNWGGCPDGDWHCCENTIFIEKKKEVSINIKELQYKFMIRSDRRKIINIFTTFDYDPNISEQINSINFLKDIITDSKKIETLWNILNK